jgi:L-fucose mutarotase/ribose pyranase (RbsD/FucU family)
MELVQINSQIWEVIDFEGYHLYQGTKGACLVFMTSNKVKYGFKTLPT